MSAVSSVLSRGTHQLSGTDIRVSAMQPQPPPPLILSEPVDERRLLVKKLPLACRLDELQTFLARASAVRILCWRFGVKPTTALLDCDSPLGIRTLDELQTFLYFQP